jgi:hypothetical protein
MSRTAPLVRIIESNKKDTDEAITVLRLQSKAWRIVAMIAGHDQKRGVALSRWLFFKTTPFVDGDAVSKFIEEHTIEAEQAGTASGVFTSRGTAGTAK